MTAFYIFAAVLCLLAAHETYLVNKVNGPYRVSRAHWLAGWAICDLLIVAALLLGAKGILS